MSSAADSPSFLSENASSSEKCPVCFGPVEKSIAFSCDGCGRPVHFSCLGLLQQDKATCERLRRYSTHVKFLCADCNGIFKIPMYNYFVDTPNVITSNYAAVFQSAEFRCEIENIISSANSNMVVEIAELRREIDVLKQSNIDLVRTLTNKAVASLTSNSTNNNNHSSDKIPCNSEVKKSYATKLSESTKSKVMIKPKVAQQAVKTQEDLLRNVDLVNENIRVTNAKTTKGGAVIVGCNDREHSNKLKRLATDKLSGDYDVFVLRSEHPKIRVVGIPSCLNKETFMNYLKSQNSDLLADATELRLLNFWELRKNKKVLQATLQLDIITYKKIMDAGGLLVGINICKVYDDTNVVRCFKCSGLNHTKNKCPRQMICPICAGSHQVNSCTSEKKMCINCRDLRHIHGFDIGVDHSAWDYTNCFAYKFALAKLRNVVFAEPIQIEINKIPNFKHPANPENITNTQINSNSINSFLASTPAPLGNNFLDVS